MLSMMAIAPTTAIRNTDQLDWCNGTNLHILFEYINLEYWFLMINEHANQNIWQAGVKQFINGMPKPFRDRHGIAIVHQRLGKLSTIHFQLGLRKQSQASVFICLSNHVPAWTAAAKPRLCAPGKVSFKRFNLAAQKSFMLLEIARSYPLTIYIDKLISIINYQFVFMSGVILCGIIKGMKWFYCL